MCGCGSDSGRLKQDASKNTQIHNFWHVWHPFYSPYRQPNTQSGVQCNDENEIYLFPFHSIRFFVEKAHSLRIDHIVLINEYNVYICFIREKPNNQWLLCGSKMLIQFNVQPKGQPSGERTKIFLIFYLKIS